MLKFYVLIQIPPNVVPEGPTDDQSGLVQVMTWHQTGATPAIAWTNDDITGPQWIITWIKEQISAKLHGITRPQWVNSLAPGKFQFNFILGR